MSEELIPIDTIEPAFFPDGAEVVIAIKVGDEVTVYEGKANQIDQMFDYDQCVKDSRLHIFPTGGYTLSIHFFESIRKRQEVTP